MKKRILSLIMIMPFIVMLLAFGFSKTVNLFVDLAAEYITWDYEEHEAFEYSPAAWERGIDLSATVYPANATNAEIIWNVTEFEAFDGLPINDPDNPIAEIRNGRLYKHREGVVDITATVSGSSVSNTFRAYLIEESEFSTEPKFVILLGRDTSEASVKSTANRYFGLYDVVNGEKKLRTETFTAMVFPSNAPSAVDVELLNADGCASYEIGETDEFGRTAVTVSLMGETDGFASLKVAAAGTDKAAYYNFSVVNGVNVYNYEDLLYCTSEAHPETAVMRANLESSENVKTRRNSALFGRKSGGSVECEYSVIPSTYDVKFYKLQGKEDIATVKVGITFRANVYGNGYTINAHELAYPSGIQEKYEEINGENVKVSETALPTLSDPFQGPLMFVEDLSCACYGQDNIGFMIEGDNIKLDNLTLKNCNNVSDLSNLDYVGTVVEINGDNVTLQNCRIMNGRTVVRSMSNKNLHINACILSYAREFIFKLGSNKFVYAPENRTVPSNKDEAYAFLSPDTDENGTPLEELVDSTATVENTFFHTSGIFCVGLDTHFAGRYLYNRSAKINNMAATSYPSELTLKGDVRFYDWKSVDGLDSSTLITAGVADDGRDFSSIFDISEIIENYYKQNPDSGLVLVKDGKNYVHGGVAFFGGGRNLSKVYFGGLNDNCKNAFTDVTKPFLIGLDDSGLGVTSSILVSAAGYGKFQFYMYNPEYTAITVGSLPELSEINSYAVM